jgi:nitroreductase
MLQQHNVGRGVSGNNRTLIEDGSMILKIGPTDIVIPAIANRWSPRAFDDKEVSAEKIAAILEAARWAPSSFNEQPWRFLVVNKFDDIDSYNLLLDGLVPFNRSWAASAPVLILVSADTTFARNGKLNRHAAFDTGQAVANLTTQATELGLSTHQIGGVDFDQLRKAFAIPEKFDLLDVITLGYQGNLLELSEELQKQEEAPRSRKELADVSFFNNFATE